MDHKSKLRQIAVVVIMALGVAHVACAQAQPEADINATPGLVAEPATTTTQASALLPAQAQVQTQVQTSALTPDEVKQSAAGNVAELQQLIKGSELSELRTTYNASYGTSLLFHGKEMTYYVALFQQKNFWRVIKTQDAARAEMIYRDFVRQTVQLSNVEIRRTQLEAQKAFTERMIALSQGRANRLQADLDVARQQQTIVANQQQQTRAEALALAQQKTAAQEQLRVAQRQVRDLQRQLESGLPAR